MAMFSTAGPCLFPLPGNDSFEPNAVVFFFKKGGKVSCFKSKKMEGFLERNFGEGLRG